MIGKREYSMLISNPILGNNIILMINFTSIIITLLISRIEIHILGYIEAIYSLLNDIYLHFLISRLLLIVVHLLFNTYLICNTFTLFLLYKIFIYQQSSISHSYNQFVCLFLSVNNISML